MSTPSPSAAIDIPSGDILVVDDVPQNLRLLTSLLSQKGHRVRSVLSGEMALKAAQISPPDLMLLDINMPRMDGYEVCRRLKNNPKTAHIPVIFVSALQDVVDKVKAFGVGGVDYITKPFHFAEVMVRVEHQLQLLQLQLMLEERNESLEREIQSRILIEEALQASEMELMALFAAMNDMILVFDRQGICQKIAPTHFNHESLSAQMAVSHHLQDFFPAEQVAEHLQTIQAVLEQQVAKTIEYYLPLRYSKRWFSANVSPLSAETVLWVARDITPAKQASEALQQQQQRSEELLLNILPEPIAQRLKQEEGTIADSFESVTVIFADLVSFTRLSTQMSSTELVEVLNTIFSEFDYIASQWGLEKIKTIGDSYMAVAGLPEPYDEDAELAATIAARRAANMALDLIDYIMQYNAEVGGQDYALRIGINTGAVVAGVIGVTKFGYDLWGDTVNVASRMESQGEPNQIQVTQATYELLKDRFELKKRGDLEVKGKGKMTTYWLLGEKD
ncbi:MAG: adenylate/guanylate cyclase domain-containing protein [Cyanobacteria bacterium P01_G01_bin.54]